MLHVVGPPGNNTEILFDCKDYAGDIDVQLKLCKKVKNKKTVSGLLIDCNDVLDLVSRKD